MWSAATSPPALLQARRLRVCSACVHRLDVLEGAAVKDDRPRRRIELPSVAPLGKRHEREEARSRCLLWHLEEGCEVPLRSNDYAARLVLYDALHRCHRIAWIAANVLEVIGSDLAVDALLVLELLAVIDS